MDCAGVQRDGTCTEGWQGRAERAIVAGASADPEKCQAKQQSWSRVGRIFQDLPELLPALLLDTIKAPQ
jgi:hypothetical protein